VLGNLFFYDRHLVVFTIQYFNTQFAPTQLFIGFRSLKLHGYMFRTEFWSSSNRYITGDARRKTSGI